MNSPEHSPEQMELLNKAFTELHAGSVAQAKSIFRRILETAPRHPHALNGLGICAESEADLILAESYYRQALQQLPHDQEFLSNLAICLQRQKRGPEALIAFEALCFHYPSADTYYNLALAQYRNRQGWNCLSSLQKILALNPAASHALLLLIRLISYLSGQVGTYEKLKKRLLQYPEEAMYHLALGLYYHMQDEEKIASRYFRATLQHNHKFLGAYGLLIRSLQTTGKYAQALDIARRLLEQASNPSALLDLVSTLQKPIPISQEESEQIRQELALIFSENSNVLLGMKASLFGQLTVPFYSVYQQGEDRALQEKMARFYSPLVKQSSLGSPAKQRPRLGIVSTHLYKHSVTDLLYRALATVLSSDAFEGYLFTLHKPQHEDMVTEQLSQAADHFIYLSEEPEQAAALIASLALDVLIYPDIGMESFNYFLALHKPARFQLVLPGHPVTTGMTTVDYFISGDVLETPVSDALYTEALVRLPGLPDYEKPLNPPSMSALELGLPQGNLYFCPMTIFKIQPEMDPVLDAILKADPHAQILLLAYKNDLQLDLRKRFQQTLQHSDRVYFLPWSAKEIFYQRLRAVDVILDSFYFGGGNTSYQAFGLGCPIVTLDQPWNKGRWTQAMYTLMGIEGLVAKDKQEYVALAVRLATDKHWQAHKRAEIKSKSSALFDKPIWSQALLQFCTELME